MLQDGLGDIVGNDVSLDTRTLSGFEEGLFAWLAIADREARTDFGIAEMGGASSQIVYPCEGCDTSADSVRTISYNDEELDIYSYSYLGLGTDEAYRSLGFPMSCRYGIGLIDEDWTVDQCADQINLTNDGGSVYDPYNFADDQFGDYTPVPTTGARVDDWFLTGAFGFMADSDFDDYCYSQNGSFDSVNGCFRVVYLRRYLEVLGLEDQPTSRSSWTLGAAICGDNNCMEPAEPDPICRWAPEGCLVTEEL